MTAFHWACVGGDVEIVEIIIKNSVLFNIDLNAKNNEGKTAFHYACEIGCAEEIAEMIIENSVHFNIDLNAKDNEGKTAFHHVCEMCRTKKNCKNDHRELSP